MAQQHILVVDNDKSKAQQLIAQLKELEFDGAVASTSQEALDSLRAARPDAILLGLDGNSVDQDLLSHLRGDGDYATSAPIVVLAESGKEGQALSAIDLGADDFIMRSAQTGELAARLRHSMSRARHNEEPSRAKALRAGPIFLNSDRRETYVRLPNGEIRPINLTKREFSLMRALMARKNTMMSREQLVEEAFGEGARVNPTNLGAYIHRLREKVEPDPGAPRYILTDRGLGFKVVDG